MYLYLELMPLVSFSLFLFVLFLALLLTLVAHLISRSPMMVMEMKTMPAAGLKLERSCPGAVVPTVPIPDNHVWTSIAHKRRQMVCS